jgi:hypothetical protein
MVARRCVASQPPAARCQRSMHTARLRLALLPQQVAICGTWLQKFGAMSHLRIVFRPASDRLGSCSVARFVDPTTLHGIRRDQNRCRSMSLSLPSSKSDGSRSSRAFVRMAKVPRRKVPENDRRKNKRPCFFLVHCIAYFLRGLGSSPFRFRSYQSITIINTTTPTTTHTDVVRTLTRPPH